MATEAKTTLSAGMELFARTREWHGMPAQGYGEEKTRMRKGLKPQETFGDCQLAKTKKITRMTARTRKWQGRLRRRDKKDVKRGLQTRERARFLSSREGRIDREG